MPIHAPFLKYFAEVARSGSVRLAASRLFISSSAVNRQILKVESELGTRLFDRLPGGMKLTEAGRILLEHVERTLADADRCIDAITSLDSGMRPPVALAAQESVIGEFLPPVLVRFHIASPETGSAFKAAGGHDLHRMLKERQADIAVVFDSDSDEEIEELCSRELSVGAIVVPRHPLAGRSSVTLAECVEWPLILPDASWPLRRLLDERLARLGAAPQVISTSNSVDFLRSMIDRQLGVGFQTAMGIEASLRAGELVQIPLHDPEPVRQRLGLCRARGAERSAPLDTLSTLLIERLEDYVAEWS